MRILVMGGGTSSERDVSLKSAKAVVEALQQLGHAVEYLDVAAVVDEDLVLAASRADLVFPILHGGSGEDGTVQELLDTAGVAYLGSGAQTSRTCFDKVAFKLALIDAGVHTPPYQVVSSDTTGSATLLGRPFVLKPALGGSSIDLVVERDPAGVTPRIERLVSRHGRMLVEELVEGVEITVPVLGDRALPAVEIVKPDGKVFDYQSKYDGSIAELCPAPSLDARRRFEAERLALGVHRLVGARHLSRIDMIVDRRGLIQVLELNTLPGMTAQSLYPKSAKAAGLDFADLMKALIRLSRDPGGRSGSDARAPGRLPFAAPSVAPSHKRPVPAKSSS